MGRSESQNPFTTTRTIRWLRDGKLVTYKFASCREIRPNAGADKCRVIIKEDNGRVTYGEAIVGGGVAKVNSRAGNATIIPMFNE